MDIRPATPEDVPGVVPMVEKLVTFLAERDPAKYQPLSHAAEMYDAWLRTRATDPRSVFLVAERAPGQLVGFLVGTVEKEVPIYRLTEYGFIHDLWMEPDYRNEGLGRQIVTLAVESFRKIGVKQVRLDVLVSNTAAQGLFKACGFRASILEMLTEVAATPTQGE